MRERHSGGCRQSKKEIFQDDPPLLSGTSWRGMQGLHMPIVAIVDIVWRSYRTLHLPILSISDVDHDGRADAQLQRLHPGNLAWHAGDECNLRRIYISGRSLENPIYDRFINVDLN
jgi:hypothetical protein